MINKQLQYTQFPIMSRSKSDQAMKFGKVKEYSRANIFLQKSCKK